MEEFIRELGKRNRKGRTYPAKCQKKYLEDCERHGLFTPLITSMRRMDHPSTYTHYPRVGGGATNEQDKELFLMYLARVGQLPQHQSTGMDGHQSLSQADFNKLSSKKKLKVF